MFGKSLRKFGHRLMLTLEESAAIQTGMAIEVDPAETGDRYARSPLIREVTTTETEVTRRGYVL